MTHPPEVPEMQDEKVRQSFRQIVEHLNFMQQHAAAAGVNTATLSSYTHTQPSHQSLRDSESGSLGPQLESH